MMLLMDGATSAREPYFLAKKEASVTLEAFKLYVEKWERQTGRKVKHVRVDEGGEFQGPWIAWCA